MYEIIVVGGGHAGIEAAHAAAVKGHKTLLVTANIKNIADMPCNPHIGGSAKGIVVREIDALGGIMGQVADKTHLQIKMLNYAKGPAVRSLRAQGDKIAYPREMLRVLNSLENLTIKEGELIKENEWFITKKTFKRFIYKYSLPFQYEKEEIDKFFNNIQENIKLSDFENLIK